mgnify:CR=1 FL=1
MQSKYYILRITKWGIVHYIDDNLKLQTISIDNYLKYCCQE